MSDFRDSGVHRRHDDRDATLASGEQSAPAQHGVARYGIRATRPEDVAAVASRALSKGAIVAVYEARLGRGVTLADPRSMEAHVLLEREGTRGFAPVVIAERAPHLFDSGTTWRVETARAEWRERLGATLQLHGSVPVRPVAADDSPRVHAILHAFAAMTDLPVILERPFERDGGPLVSSPEEALRRFLAMHVDALVLDGVFFEKRAELHQPLNRASSIPPDPRRVRLVG